MKNTVLKLVKYVKRFVQEADGADMVEYGLVLALVAIVASVALHTLGNTISNELTSISTQISGAL